MSFWLKNVGNFLEKLDDRAEQVVEEQRVSLTEQILLGGGAGGDFHDNDHVASILAARGLAAAEDEEDEEEPAASVAAATAERGKEGVVANEKEDVVATVVNDDDDATADDDQELVKDKELLEVDLKSSGADASAASSSEEQQQQREAGEVAAEQAAAETTTAATVKDIRPLEEEEGNTRPQGWGDLSFTANDGDGDMNVEEIEKESGSIPVFPPEQSKAAASASSAPPPPVLSTLSTSTAKVALNAFKSLRSNADAGAAANQNATSDDLSNQQADAAVSSPSSRQLMLDAQKQVRTLRRHVVALNKQLEGAEAEMQAQRGELERAAERMSKDASRFKEERDKERTNHANEIKVLKTQHDTMWKDQKLRYDAQLEEMRSQLRTVEERRMQEGGDWNKELADAIEREQEAIGALASVEDEKSTLLSQISILQAQQEALGNRLESLSQTAENAFAREREAEDRLDEALSVHARQISQRQFREADLERTVTELGKALVAAERNARGTTIATASQLMAEDGTVGKHHDSSESLHQVVALETELETLRVQFAHEQQRNHTLQTELREVSQEWTEETLIAQMRQQQHDRQVDELTQSLSRLKIELRDARRESIQDAGKRDRNADDEDARQIKGLSEEVLRQRDKLSSSQCEIAALKSRLQAALERAQKAESSLDEKLDTDAASDDLEFGNGVRHRRGNLRKRGKEAKSSTIRSALKLDGVYQGGGTEKIGKTLDALDSFLASSGRFLRYNPLARLLFIVYLLLIHIWTFVLLFFHAHGFETIHGDFGAGESLPHGPGALMLPQTAQQQQLVPKEVGGQ